MELIVFSDVLLVGDDNAVVNTLGDSMEEWLQTFSPHVAKTLAQQPTLRVVPTSVLDEHPWVAKFMSTPSPPSTASGNAGPAAGDEPDEAQPDEPAFDESMEQVWNEMSQQLSNQAFTSAVGD